MQIFSHIKCDTVQITDFLGMACFLNSVLKNHTNITKINIFCHLIKYKIYLVFSSFKCFVATKKGSNF